MRLLRRLFWSLLVVAVLGASWTFMPGSGGLLVHLAAWQMAPDWQIRCSKVTGNCWGPVRVADLEVADAEGEIWMACREGLFQLRLSGLWPGQDGRWLKQVSLRGARLGEGTNDREMVETLLAPVPERAESIWRALWQADWFVEANGVAGRGKTEGVTLWVDLPAEGPGVLLMRDAQQPLARGTLVRHLDRLQFDGWASGLRGMELKQGVMTVDPTTSCPRRVLLEFQEAGGPGQLRADFTRVPESGATAASVVGETLPVSAIRADFLPGTTGVAGRCRFQANWTTAPGGVMAHLAFAGQAWDLAGEGFEVSHAEFAGHVSGDEIVLRRLNLAHERNRLEARARLPRVPSVSKLGAADWELEGRLVLSNPAALREWTQLLDYLALDENGSLTARLRVGRTRGWAWGGARVAGEHLRLAGIPFDAITASLDVEGSQLKLHEINAEGPENQLSAQAWLDLGGSELFQASVRLRLQDWGRVRERLPELPWLAEIKANGVEMVWDGDGSRSSHSAAFRVAADHVAHGGEVGTRRFSAEGSYSPERLILRHWELADDHLVLAGNASLGGGHLTAVADLFGGESQHLGSVRLHLPSATTDYPEFLRHPSLDPERSWHLEGSLFGARMETVAQLLGAADVGRGEVWGRLSWHGPPAQMEGSARLVLMDFHPPESWQLPAPLYLEGSASSRNGWLNAGGTLFLPGRPPTRILGSLPWPGAEGGEGAAAFQMAFDAMPATVFPEWITRWTGVMWQEGRMTGSLAGWRNEARWRMDGKLDGRNLVGEIRETGLAFSQFEASLNFEEDAVRINQAQAQIGEGRLSIEGVVSAWTSPEEREWDLAFVSRGIAWPLPFACDVAEGSLSGQDKALSMEATALVDPKTFEWLGNRSFEQPSASPLPEPPDNSLLPMPLAAYDIGLITGHARGLNRIPATHEKAVGLPVWRIQGRGDRFRLFQEITRQSEPESTPTPSAPSTEASSG